LKSFASLAILACGAFASNQRKRRSPGARFRHGFFFALGGLAAYAALVLSFVVRIDFPDHTYQFRSVGFWRTQLGRQHPDLKNAPAGLAIKIAGTEEEAIETVWEPWSIYVVRLLLFASYTLTLGSLNFAFGAVKIEVNDPVPT
jgi:hypothetical protein